MSAQKFRRNYLNMILNIDILFLVIMMIWSDLIWSDQTDDFDLFNFEIVAIVEIFNCCQQFLLFSIVANNWPGFTINYVELFNCSQPFFLINRWKHSVSNHQTFAIVPIVAMLNFAIVAILPIGNNWPGFEINYVQLFNCYQQLLAWISN